MRGKMEPMTATSTFPAVAPEAEAACCPPLRKAAADPEAARDLAHAFKALGDPTRVQLLSIVGSLFVAVAYRETSTAVAEWVGIAISALVLILLWTPKASAFFRN
jgi:hypothetical protein